VTNCTEPPCKFVRGKEIAAEVDFIPGEWQIQKIGKHSKTHVSYTVFFILKS
jgi:hypothetical protein